MGAGMSKITVTVTIDCNVDTAVKILRAAGRENVRCRASMQIPVKRGTFGPEAIPTIERGSCAKAVEKLQLFYRQTKLSPQAFAEAKGYAEQLAECTKGVPGLNTWQD